MRRSLITALACGLLLAAGANAQCSLSQPAGLVANVRMTSTVNYGDYSKISIAWDYSSTGCVNEYVVETFRQGDNAKIASNTLTAASPNGGTTAFTSQNLTPAGKYVFKITAYNRNKGLAGTGSTGSVNSNAFTAAPKPSCNSNAAPGLVKNLRLTSTYNEGQYSFMNIAWDYQGPGCVTEYSVQTFRQKDGMQIGSTTVTPASPTAGATYKSQTLTPGEKYFFKVTARNMRLGASNSAGSINSAAYTAAPAACNANAPAGLVSNVRMTSTTNEGQFSYISIAWDYKSPNCVTSYTVQTYRARDGVNIGSASVPATTQLGGNYKSSTLTPGEKYTFKITATNGRLGATGSAGSVNSPAYQAAGKPTPVPL